MRKLKVTRPYLRPPPEPLSSIPVNRAAKPCLKSARVGLMATPTEESCYERSYREPSGPSTPPSHPRCQP